VARPFRWSPVAGALLVFGCALPGSMLSGCSVPDNGFRTDGHLDPSGPCWSVNIGDGLDEASAMELQTLFACIDQDGALRPLAPLVGRLDEPDRDGVALGVRVAQLVNRLPTVDIDIWNLASTALELLESEEPIVEPVLELGVELLYGRPWGTVRSDVALADPAELAQGVLTPLLPLIGPTSTVLIDSAPGIPGLLADAAEDDAVGDMLCTLVGIAETGDPEIRAIADRVMADLGVALALTRDPWNDRWRDASGDSARDLVSALLTFEDDAGRTFLEGVNEPLGAILRDDPLQYRVEDALESAVEGDHVDPLPLQLRYLAETAVDGGSLGAGDDSALLGFLRLLDQANQPMECSLDLWVTDLEIDLGNLSVSVLRALARIDPSTTETGVSLLGAVLGWDLSRATLDLIADSGVCPTLDAQLVSDLQAVDRLNDPEVGDLLVVMLDVLAAFVDSGTDEDRIPELVDVLAHAHAAGLVPPVEEVLRDVGDSALMGDLTAAVPVILDPSPLAVDTCPTGSQPLDFGGMWGLLRVTLVGGTEPALLDRLAPAAEVWIDDDATWLALGNLSVLLAADGSRVRELPALSSRLLAADPDLSILRDLTPLLRDPTLSAPVLRLAESPAIADELGRTDLEQEGPLPFFARLLTGGTLDVALRTLDLAIGWLTGLADTPEDSP
jgi:hypothetical protein